MIVYHQNSQIGFRRFIVEQCAGQPQSARQSLTGRIEKSQYLVLPFLSVVDDFLEGTFVPIWWCQWRTGCGHSIDGNTTLGFQSRHRLP